MHSQSVRPFLTVDDVRKQFEDYFRKVRDEHIRHGGSGQDLDRKTMWQDCILVLIGDGAVPVDALHWKLEEVKEAVL